MLCMLSVNESSKCPNVWFQVKLMLWHACLHYRGPQIDRIYSIIGFTPGFVVFLSLASYGSRRISTTNELRLISWIIPYQYQLQYIFSGCDLDSPRKPGPKGEQTPVIDGQTPLHLASSWGLERVVQTLLEFNAQINIQVGVVAYTITLFRALPKAARQLANLINGELQNTCCKMFWG